MKENIESFFPIFINFFSYFSFLLSHFFLSAAGLMLELKCLMLTSVKKNRII